MSQFAQHNVILLVKYNSDLLKSGWGDAKKVQKVRSFAALREDSSSVLSTHNRHLKLPWTSGSKGSITLFWPPRALTHTCHILKQTHTYKKKRIKRNL